MSETALINNEGSDLMKMMQLTAMNVNSISKQMGLALDKIGEHDRAIESIRDDITAIKQSKRVERSQASRLKSSILSRVNYVLGIEYEGGRVADDCIYEEMKYRRAFIGRAYHDARTKSKLGTPVSETLKVDFDETLKYINSWEPEVKGGIDGFKDYLDIRYEKKLAK